MKVLDRYLIRETIAPFLLALAVYTFVLAVDPMLSQAQLLLSKGVPIPTVAFMLITLLPQALGVTIPMAFLTGLLIALGRMSGDRESVALLACGVSPLRLLRPVLLLGAVIGLVDLYVMVKAVPDGNLAFVQARWKLLSEQSESDIKPRVFFERFPGMVLYVNDDKPGGGWDGVLLAETSPSGRPATTPTITTAESGSLQIDNEQKLVRLVLLQATRYSPGEDGSRIYTTSRQSPISITITPEAVFGTGTIDRGLPEMRISDLNAVIAAKHKAGVESPHNEIMYLHQKFSFPVACLVFAMLGLALGLNTRKEGKLAGLTLGLAVILIYWGLMGLADAWTKAGNWGGARGGLPAEWARWLPNIVLGLLGAGAVWWRGRASGGALTLQAPEWLTRWRRKPLASQEGVGRRGHASAPRTVVVIRIPRLALPAPRILDRYVSGKYLKTIGLAFVSLIALYYVGTFLDMSQKLFKGQADTWMFFSYPLVLDAEVRRLRRAERDARRRPRDHRRPDPDRRTDGHARVRRQPLPDGAASPPHRRGVERRPVHARRARFGHRQPARRDPERRHSRPAAAHLRRQQSQLAGQCVHRPGLLLRVARCAGVEPSTGCRSSKPRDRRTD